jgi:hypothetical protein
MLVAELATSRGVDEPEAAVILAKALGKSNLRFPEPL